ncbi:MAG: hypothetical protein WBN95_03105 [Gammaproteobacteria bacterium]
MTKEGLVTGIQMQKDIGQIFLAIDPDFAALITRIPVAIIKRRRAEAGFCQFIIGVYQLLADLYGQ